MLPSLLVFSQDKPYNSDNYLDRSKLNNENLCSI